MSISALTSSGSIPPSSRTPARTAASSAARKKNRSKTSSKTRRSSWDFASVAASASRKSAGSAHEISLRTAKPSSSSLVPTATPSERSSSPNSRIRAASPGRGGLRRAPCRSPSSTGTERAGQLCAHPLDHDVKGGAVLDDDRHRVVERLLVDVVGAEQQQRARPVDQLRDRRRLLQVQAAHHRDDLDQPAPERV